MCDSCVGCCGSYGSVDVDCSCRCCPLPPSSLCGPLTCPLPRPPISWYPKTCCQWPLYNRRARCCVSPCNAPKCCPSICCRPSRPPCSGCPKFCATGYCAPGCCSASCRDACSTRCCSSACCSPAKSCCSTPCRC